MTCKFHASEIALEWWRASGPKSPERLAALVDHQLNIHAVHDRETIEAVHADALANRHPWELADWKD